MELHLAPHVCCITSINESLQPLGELLPGLADRWGDFPEGSIVTYGSHGELCVRMYLLPTQLCSGHLKRLEISQTGTPITVFEGSIGPLLRLNIKQSGFFLFFFYTFIFLVDGQEQAMSSRHKISGTETNPRHNHPLQSVSTIRRE